MGECVVCLNLLHLNSFVVPLPCNKAHIFHPTCLFEWVKLNYTCPVCRKPMIKDEEEILRYL